ncbi:MAG: helix-turn-helix domain-containing protein [Candidatus Marinimicrobia bacterium]|jgi:excisionase family DNA binding protein|nr:helix-turn-helix domain-containing protein [Candidatus Neomarinimicrobiota bacterium]
MNHLQLLTPSEVSDILKVNYRKVLDLIILGKLEAIKIGRQYRIEKSELLNYLEKNKIKRTGVMKSDIY